MSVAVWIVSFALLWIPGSLALQATGRSSSPDLLVRAGKTLALGLAFWPVLFLWTSVAGVNWTATSARLFFLVLVAAALVSVAGRVHPIRAIHRAANGRHFPWLLLVLILVALAVVSRALQIRNLVVPPWVDPVHHTAISRLLVEQGILPATYGPYIPDGVFVYHWGFHVLIAWAAWITGQTQPIEIAEVMLTFGQLLNAMTLLMVYISGRALFRSRRAGFFAATLAVFVSWLPAYYVSWGRYTQLAGLLVAPIFILELWRLHKDPTFGGAVRVVLLGAGLFLLHVRVTLFALTFVATLALLVLANRAWSTLVRWLLSGIAVVLLVSPWLYRIIAVNPFGGAFVSETAAADGWWSVYNAIPWTLVWVPNNRELMALASGGLTGLSGWQQATTWLQITSAAWLVLLLYLASAWAQRRWQKNAPFRLPLPAAVRDTGGWQPWSSIGVILVWCALTMLMLNLNLFGLPPLTFVTNSSAVISIFLPLSLIGGALLAWCCTSLVPARWVAPVTLVAVTAISLLGMSDMTDVVNRETVLVEAEDLVAMQWIREQTDPGAVFLIAAKRWQGHTYVGTDAGYWISVLADRRTTTPPALYGQASSAGTIAAINDIAASIETSGSIGDALDDPVLRQKLRVASVTYVYIGQRNDRNAASSLLDREDVRLVYHQDAVYVFELLEPTG